MSPTIDHSGLGAAYIRSHPGTPIAHDQFAACGWCGQAAAPVTDAGLDVERLGEAIFRVGTGLRDRATASIPARIANSQDGAKASGEFADLVAAEYAALSRQAEKDNAATRKRRQMALDSHGQSENDS